MRNTQIALITILGVLAFVSTVPVENNAGKRLIKSSETGAPQWLSESEINELVEGDKKFMDITHMKNFPETAIKVSQSKGIPTALKYKEIVNQAFNSINLTHIESFIENFSRFYNRYYDDNLGIESEKWLLGQINSSVQGYPGSLSIIEVEHKWLQNSIIARITGTDQSLRSEVVILGAHQDSINSQGSDLRAPGADDNASGCITLLEALKAIVANGIIPKRTVEFHWYAGEERGLLGSLDIASSYRSEGINVVGMINFDVVGYYVEGNDDVAIITDYVDNDLTQFLRILVEGYLEFGRRERDCGYACSDHAAWTQYGFPSARPTQAVRNPQMHTLSDTIDTVSFVQIREFVKIAIGFAVELAEPNVQQR